VTAPVLFGQMHVAPAVTSFLQTYPQVKVELLLLDRVVNLVEEGIDVGVRIARLEDASMIATAVGEMRQVVVASPKLLEKVGVPKRPEALEELPCVQFQGLAAAPVWVFREGAKSLSVGIDGPMVCNQASSALDACAAGIGFGRFLSYQVAPYLKAKKLRVVLEAFEPPAIPVSVVYAHARLMSPRVRVFVDWMKERLRNA
jgi:DNA-binding transcriptional LysR family regulator